MVLNPYAGEKFECLRNALVARFAPICGHLAVKDFHMLMDDMAREQIRGENAKRRH